MTNDPQPLQPNEPNQRTKRSVDDRRYSRADQRIALAAADRYGTKLGRRELEQVWEVVPKAGTMMRWRQEGIEADEEALEFWLVHEGKRTAQLKVQIADRLAPALEAFDQFVADGSALKMQQAAVAIGILYDKLVPPPSKGGAAVNVSAGPGGTVQMLVVAPSEVEGAEHKRIV